MYIFDLLLDYLKRKTFIYKTGNSVAPRLSYLVICLVGSG